MQAIPVDVIVLSRDEGPLPAEVEQSLRRQRNVRIRLIRVAGRPAAEDRHRWQTIARARNQGQQQAVAPWVMYLDDDVVLESDGVYRLWQELQRRPNLAAAAADYRTAESHSAAAPYGSHRHVAMGATLFRASALRVIRFRYDPQQCECQCCCDDLRAHGWGIDYAAGVRARHLSLAGHRDQGHDRRGNRRPRVLTAFDRRDVFRFERQFLETLRRSGNNVPVSAVTYGLYPSEVSRLASIPGVEVHPHPVDGRMAPIRRLEDFAEVTATLSPETPIAYWDCADVFFQASLDPLWNEARERAGLILAAREPLGYPENAAVVEWTRTIRDREARAQAFELLSQNPFLNSGFVAGTTAAMQTYFRTAAKYLSGRELAGTLDWGDQTALNYYCHRHPDRWHEIEAGWNFCVHDRYGDIVLSTDGLVSSREGKPVHVVHGNARSFRHLALSYLGQA